MRSALILLCLLIGCTETQFRVAYYEAVGCEHSTPEFRPSYEYTENGTIQRSVCKHHYATPEAAYAEHPNGTVRAVLVRDE